MLNAPLRIIIVAALCVLGLIGLVVREGYERDHGETVILQMYAVDPRALLSGHYVTVGIQDHPTRPGLCRYFTLAETQPAGWIRLEPHNWLSEQSRNSQPTHEATGFFAMRGSADATGGIGVRGSVNGCTDAVIVGDEGTFGTINLDLGISRFYTNQRQAERIERALQTQEARDTIVLAIISIGRDGRARLKGLNVNGEIIELNWL